MKEHREVSLVYVIDIAQSANHVEQILRFLNCGFAENQRESLFFMPI